MNMYKRLTIAAGVGVVVLVCNSMGAAQTDSLHDAAERGDVAAIKQLIAAGDDVNVRRSVKGGSVTPLHFAAQEGHADIVEALVAAGADVNAMTIRGHTPLVYARSNSHVGVITVLETAAQ